MIDLNDIEKYTININFIYIISYHLIIIIIIYFYYGYIKQQKHETNFE
jgi:hypothetical protein